MTEYLINIETQFQRDDAPNGSCGSTSTKYFFQVDKFGNVNVRKQSSSHCSGHATEYHQISSILCIQDNVEIPSFFLPLLKLLILGDSEKNIHDELGRPQRQQLSTNTDMGISFQIYKRYWQIVETFIKSTKTMLATEPILYGQKLIAFQNDLTEKTEQVAALRNVVDILNNEVNALKRKVQEQQAELNENEKVKLFHLKGLKQLKEENDFLRSTLISLQNEKNIFQLRETLKNLQL